MPVYRAREHGNTSNNTRSKTRKVTKPKSIWNEKNSNWYKLRKGFIMAARRRKYVLRKDRYLLHERCSTKETHIAATYCVRARGGPIHSHPMYFFGLCIRQQLYQSGSPPVPVPRYPRRRSWRPGLHGAAAFSMRHPCVTSP